jgi:hypothetical protein
MFDTLGRMAGVAAAGGALAAAALGVAGGAAANPGNCLAWFGTGDNRVCMGYSSGSQTSIGTPAIGVFGSGNGLGIVTGPLLPGQTINVPISP